jgi:hypothetical protein
VLDISTGGVGLLLAEALQPGDLFTLHFPRHGTPRPLEVAARVVYSTAQRRGAWVLGCQFAVELTAAELASVLP